MLARLFRRNRPDPTFEHLPTPGEVLDAALVEHQQADDGAIHQIISDLMAEIEALKALYDAQAVKVAGLEARMQQIEDRQ